MPGRPLFRAYFFLCFSCRHRNAARPLITEKTRQRPSAEKADVPRPSARRIVLAVRLFPVFSVPSFPPIIPCFGLFEKYIIRFSAPPSGRPAAAFAGAAVFLDFSRFRAYNDFRKKPRMINPREIPAQAVPWPGRRRGNEKTLRQKDRILTHPGKQRCTDEVRRLSAAESFR